MSYPLIFIGSAFCLAASLYGAHNKEYGWALLFNFFASTMFCLGVLSWLKA